MREPLTMDDYIDLDLDHAGSSPQDRRELAEQLRTWAEHPHPDSELTTSQLLTLAGERFVMLKDYETAEECLDRAVATLGPDPSDEGLDPRCHLISLYLTQGRTDEALECDGNLRRSRPESLSTYAFMGDLWRESDDPQRALGWVNRGLVSAERTGAFSEGGISLLRQTRALIRRSLGHEPDESDEMALAAMARRRQQLEQG